MPYVSGYSREVRPTGLEARSRAVYRAARVSFTRAVHGGDGAVIGGLCLDSSGRNEMTTVRGPSVPY